MLFAPVALYLICLIIDHGKIFKSFACIRLNMESDNRIFECCSFYWLRQK